jgi:tripartite-type tricarboxylate transporter receptor subunit TctC
MENLGRYAAQSEGTMRTITVSLRWAAYGVLCCLTPSLAVAQTSFFQGKTVAIIQGREPGGTGDMRVRAMIPFLQKYTPGNPSFVSEYMPGGGGRKAANQVYRSARPDGLTIGNPGVGMVSAAVLGE